MAAAERASGRALTSRSSRHHRGGRRSVPERAPVNAAAAVPHHAILALRVNDRAGEICAKPLKRAESRDVENTAEAPFATRRRVACHHTVVGRLAFLTDCRSCLEVARTRDALGRLERSLLSAAFRALQFTALARRDLEHRWRLFLWAVVGVCPCDGRQLCRRSDFIRT